MKSVDQVLHQLKDHLTDLESRRIDLWQQQQQAISLIWLILGFGGGLSLVGLLLLIVPGLILGAITLFVAAVVYNYRITPLFQQYREDFKQNFIAELLTSTTDQMQYYPEGDRRILEEYFRSELFPAKPDREKIEDAIFARLGATDLVASELHTEYRRETRDKNGKQNVSWHTIFQGLFISADFHKDFRGCTFVRTDVAEKFFGSWGRMFQKPVFSNLQLIHLEDVDFEREFVVHSDDQIEARYILSPAMMRRMLELKQKFSSRIEFSFLQSRVFLAISHTEDFFEPELRQSVLDPVYLRNHIQQVQLVLGVVEALDLNTRLWTKR
jgi:hypothetical protein